MVFGVVLRGRRIGYLSGESRMGSGVRSIPTATCNYIDPIQAPIRIINVDMGRKFGSVYIQNNH